MARSFRRGGPAALSPKGALLQMEIVGAKELEAALLALGQDRLIKATLKRGLLKAAQPAVRTAQGLAPRRSGRMASKIAVSSTLSRRQRRAQGYGARTSTRGGSATVYLGAAPRGPAVLDEFGTGPRFHRKTGKFVGATPAQPFMRPAWEQHKEQILRDFSRELWIQIEKSAERLARRQMKAAGL